MASLTPEGGVVIEGELAGKLDGFRFTADASAEGVHLRTIRNAAFQALQSEIEARAFRFERHARIDDGKIIAIDEDGTIRWEGMAVARLLAGHDVMSPRIELLADPELLSAQTEIAVREAVDGWLARRIRAVFEPLLALQASPEIEGPSKGLAFQLTEAMGVLARSHVVDLLKGIEQLERGKLRKLGVRFGERHIFMPGMLKPAVTALKLRLWRAAKGITQSLPVPNPGLSSAPAQADVPEGFYNIIGYEVCGPRAIRIDMLERLMVQLRQKNIGGGFPLTAALWSPVGCSVGDFEGVMRALGYAPQPSRTAAPTPEVLPEAETETETPKGPAEIVEGISETFEAPNDAAPIEMAGEDAASAEEPQSGNAGGPVEPIPAPGAPVVLWKFQPRRERQHNPRNKQARRPQSETIKLSAPSNAPENESAPSKRRAGGKTARPRNTVSIKLAQAPANTGSPGAPKPTGSRAPSKKLPARERSEPRKPPEKAIDPDSPFAKLQALKERMQKSS